MSTVAGENSSSLRYLLVTEKSSAFNWLPVIAGITNVCRFSQSDKHVDIGKGRVTFAPALG
jgi:hypothetical protein